MHTQPCEQDLPPRGARATGGVAAAGFQAALLFLLSLCCGLLPSLGADYLPDAAAHLGTVVINANDEFTTNLAVTLTLAAVDDGSGVAQMQFSNDDTHWSAPEPYQTSKQWLLADDGVYPPQMNSALKTVFVRFQDGAGNWSPAVSDSIVFAKSPADVPQIKQVWIAQQAPADYDPNAEPGSESNPFQIPAGANELAFDTLLHALITTYRGYVPQPRWTTNAPAPATNCTVLTVHLGPGLYQTHGDDEAYGSSLSWVPQNGWRILGAGKGATTLQAVGVSGGWACRTDVIGGGGDNVEVADLTIDANIHEGGTNMTGQCSVGVSLCGNNLQLRRLRIKNFGSHHAGSELGGICLNSAGAEYDLDHMVIEDCEVGQMQYGNTYDPNDISISGEPVTYGTMRYFRNLLVRNCYLDGTPYDGDTPIDMAQYSFKERADHGLGVGGVAATILEDNLVVNTRNGYYVDTATLHDITVRNNHFRNVLQGAVLGLGDTPTAQRRVEGFFRFEHNLVELDPHFYTNGDTWGDFGWRHALLLTGNQKGPTNYTFNALIISSNIFQYTEQQPPETNVGAIAGQLQAFQTADLGGNIFLGMQRGLNWDNSPAYLREQVDLVEPSRATPVVCQQNRRADNSVLEAYPYVLDRTLPRPVVVAGEEVVLPVPTVNGVVAPVVEGLPGGTIGSDGVLHWRTTPQDTGAYVVSFYDSTHRLSDPRRTLVTVQNPLLATDARYFANGLVAYWKFNETSGTTLGDTSGNEAHADVSRAVANGQITVGAPGWKASRRAVHFNHSDPSLGIPFEVQNADAALFSGFPLFYHPLLDTGTTLYHPLSIGFWFEEETKPARAQALFVRSGDGDSFTWLSCSVAPSPTNNDGNVSLTFSVANDTLSVTTPPALKVGVWHQVVIVYDGASASIYVDAVLLAQQNCGQLTAFDAETTLRFGGGLWFDSFVGSLADVAIWNRPLSATEITRLHRRQWSGAEPLANPLPPAGLHAQPSAASQVTLTWSDNSMNESNFVLQRSPNKSRWTTVATLPANTVSWVDTLPSGAGRYYYRVRAVNRFGASAYSKVAAVALTQ